MRLRPTSYVRSMMWQSDGSTRRWTGWWWRWWCSTQHFSHFLSSSFHVQYYNEKSFRFLPLGRRQSQFRFQFSVCYGGRERYAFSSLKHLQKLPPFNFPSLRLPLHPTPRVLLHGRDARCCATFAPLPHLLL